MKVAIGSKFTNKPWGGGNLFVQNLSQYLLKNGVEVVFNLGIKDIDTILLFDPRKDSKYATFDHFDIKYYKKNINKNVKVIHRINECDERKGTSGVNDFYIHANECADYTVFVSKWLEEIYKNQGFDRKSLVIKAGANKKIFNPDGRANMNESTSINIVTHHWGSNWNKGFDMYALLDEMIGKKIDGKSIKFTYIGNIPDNFKFKNSNHIQPLSGLKLAQELKKNHIYLTGSLNEPSGNHHIEAAQCGLPLLYINSGGIPEYCEGYGVKFEKNNLFQKLEELVNSYDFYFNKMISYENSAENMSENFLVLFKNLNGFYKSKRLKIKDYYFLAKQKAKYYLI